MQAEAPASTEKSTVWGPSIYGFGCKWALEGVGQPLTALSTCLTTLDYNTRSMGRPCFTVVRPFDGANNDQQPQVGRMAVILKDSV